MRTCYLLVGVGRSGTSALAGTFYRSFAPLPVQMLDMIPANEGNPSGFYEDAQVVALNDQILNEAGTWVLCDNKVSFNHLLTETTYDDSVRAVLSRYTADTFCIKDPRLSLTLPVYLRVLRGMEVECHVVHVKRDRAGIVRSLGNRDSMHSFIANRLIDKYRQALEELEQASCFGDVHWDVVHFNDFMEAPMQKFAEHFPDVQPVWPNTLPFLGIEAT